MIVTLDCMKPRLLDQLRDAIRVRNYSIRTEQAYSMWTKRFIRFHQLKHPAEMGDLEVVAFLTHLAVNRNVAANTQNQALNALVFLYKRVIGKPLGDLSKSVRAKKPKKLPVVLTRDEVRRVLFTLQGSQRLILTLLYGSGLRLMKALQLRVKEFEFNYQCLHIHDAKGHKDRIVTFPASLHRPFSAHQDQVKVIHASDLAAGYGEVYLPNALNRKYRSAGISWQWQTVFPGNRISVDPRSGKERRYHLLPSTIQKALKKALSKAEVSKPASSHSFRHSFATHALENGMDIRTVQQQLGHSSLETTEIVTHVLKRGGQAVRSPLEDIFPGALLQSLYDDTH